MPKAYNKILKFNQDKKYIKFAFVICGNQNLYSEKYTHVIAIQKISKIMSKINKHVVWFIIHRLFHFIARKSKHDFYIGGDMMSFSRKLWELLTEIIN